jgi:hypothetical protein
MVVQGVDSEQLKLEVKLVGSVMLLKPGILP